MKTNGKINLLARASYEKDIKEFPFQKGTGLKRAPWDELPEVIREIWQARERRVQRSVNKSLK